MYKTLKNTQYNDKIMIKKINPSGKIHYVVMDINLQWEMLNIQKQVHSMKLLMLQIKFHYFDYLWRSCISI